MLRLPPSISGRPALPQERKGRVERGLPWFPNLLAQGALRL